ncbi:MAG: deoxyribodipyrimidine photo-lyase [Dehalococcoidia bacterium]|nr:deoxyribodipyrimidine photo-lyase [Dehalococcoidia bacterium]
MLPEVRALCEKNGIQPERIKSLNDKKVKKARYVLYWMQASQRTRFNHALEYAVLAANNLGLPVIVVFGLSEDYPEANERHYYFMLEGLEEVEKSLKERGMKLVVRRQSPYLAALELAREAALVIVDRGYLRIQRYWREQVARQTSSLVAQVESDVVVPVESASAKEEYSAATLRPKLQRMLGRYLKQVPESFPCQDSLSIDLESFDVSDAQDAITRLNIDRAVGKSRFFRGGATEACNHLEEFVETKLDAYGELRNDPTCDCLSNMSPYLHFGQISPVEIALKVLDSGSPGAGAYLEELIVRRELAMNYAFHNQAYDSFEAVPDWAKETLAGHRSDKRPFMYSLEELESALTCDAYWNASQEQMRITGKMHSYMRMYWGKKIIEWSASAEEAFNRAVYLNNKYEIDGRDPNGFAGVVWCFGKHDRAWGEKPVFGKVRSMTSGGLRRKFDADKYVRTVERLGELDAKPES